MYIDIEATPNPNAKKFILEKEILKNSSKQFNTPEDAKGDPLAEKLFHIDGITSVFYMSDFVTIEKRDYYNWLALEGDIKRTIIENLPSLSVKTEHNSEINEDDNLAKINRILDETVRPGLAMDGGGLEVISLSDDLKLSVKYKGACGSCPSATFATLHAITSILKETFNPDVEVIPV